MRLTIKWKGMNTPKITDHLNMLNPCIPGLESLISYRVSRNMPQWSDFDAQ